MIKVVTMIEFIIDIDRQYSSQAHFLKKARGAARSYRQCEQISYPFNQHFILARYVNFRIQQKLSQSDALPCWILYCCFIISIDHLFNQSDYFNTL